MTDLIIYKYKKATGLLEWAAVGAFFLARRP